MARAGDNQKISVDPLEYPWGFVKKSGRTVQEEDSGRDEGSLKTEVLGLKLRLET